MNSRALWALQRLWLHPVVRVPRAAVRAYSTPWYVSEQPARHEPAVETALPKDPPATLAPLCRQLVAEYGLEDVSVLDARDRPTALGPALMVVGTGKSIRHLGRATAELKAWLKREHSVAASSEGTLTANFVRTWRRRTKRRQERQRSYAPAVEIDPTLQRKTGDWIVVDTRIDGIYVHMLTADKRLHLDFENLLGDVHEGEMPLQEFALPRSPAPGPASGAASRATRKYSTRAAPRAAPRAASHHPLLSKAALETINGAPLSELVAALESHLIQGTPIRKKDLKQIFTAIAYHRSQEIAATPFSKESVAEWRKLCDEKTRTILAVVNLVARPQGQNILSNDEILLLLWRAFVNPCKESITPSTALADPTTQTAAAGFSDTRSVGFLHLLAERSQYAHPHVLVPLLCGLLNSKSWGMFWQLLDKATLTVDLPPAVIDTVVAMVVKTGNEKMIVHALTSFLPGIYRAAPFTPSPELKRAVAAGLAVIDPDQKAYRHLRRFMGEQSIEPRQTRPHRATTTR